MSFFFNLQKKTSTTRKVQKQAVSLDLCKEHGCTICPRNKDESLKTPKMSPTGSGKPIIYILGESPSSDADKKGAQFGGMTGRFLRSTLKDIFGARYVASNVRVNNCVRCKPSKVLTPQEIACCKSSVEKDIEETKPLVIIGTGNIPLHWMLNVSGISHWRGRKIPVKIGSHTAWYFPIIDPEYVIRKRNKGGYATEYDEVFKLDLKNIEKFLAQKEVPTPKVIDSGYEDNIHFVTGRGEGDFSTVRKWLLHLRSLPATAIDIETTGLFPWDGHKLLTIAIGTDEETYVFPIEHPDGWKDEETIEEVKVLLKDFLMYSGTKVAHNLKFELTWFLHYFGIDIIHYPAWADTMSQAYVLDERSGNRILSLDILCLQNFGFNLKALTSVDTRNVLGSKLEDVLLYNGMDTKYTYKLYINQSTRMPESLKRVERHHNHVCGTLALTETKGVLVNQRTSGRISRKLDKEIVKIEEELYSLPEVAKYEKRYGEEFNFASSPKLVKMLRDVLGIPRIKKTGNEGYSTDKTVLQELAKKGIKLPVYIEKLREVKKLKSTYVDSIPKLVSDDGILRASFNSCRTDTGRFSSTAPNMQNFPKRNNSYVRKQVVAPKGYTFVAVDYGQLEARVICMASGETNIIEHDVHADWAERIIKVYPRAANVKRLSDISDEDFKKFRSKVKNALVFPWFYGAGKDSVGASLGLPKHISEKLYREFNSYFSRVKTWQDETIKFYNKHGYAVGLTGRRRRPPLTRNQLLNNTIQGAASDIVVAAMNRLSYMSYELETEYYQPILNIHDDLSFYIPDDKLDEAVREIAKVMVKDFPLMNGVPLEVEVMVGKNWYALEEYGTFSLANL